MKPKLLAPLNSGPVPARRFTIRQRKDVWKDALGYEWERISFNPPIWAEKYGMEKAEEIHDGKTI